MSVAVSWQFKMNKNMQIDWGCILIFWWCYKTLPYPKLMFCMLRATEGIRFTLLSCEITLIIVNLNLTQKKIVNRSELSSAFWFHAIYLKICYDLYILVISPVVSAYILGRGRICLEGYVIILKLITVNSAAFIIFVVFNKTE